MRAVGTALFALVTFAAALPAREPTKNELLIAIEKQLKSANETAGQSVVCIVVSRSDRYPKPTTATDRPGKLGTFDAKEFLKAKPTEERLARTLDLSRVENVADHGYACGVILDATGLILTPYHVVDGATKIYVHVPGRVGSYADIHAADARHDLAVLKLINPPEKLTAIKFAEVRLDRNNGLRPTVSAGQLAILMAHAAVPGFAIDRPSAALGSLTNVRHPTEREPAEGMTSDSFYHYGGLLEYGAILEPAAKATGVSGAALLNLDGEMIGLTTTTAIFAGQAAFPADESFRRVVGVLRRGEEVEYGFLGVSVNKGAGLNITVTTAFGPAARAGLRPGDTITRINGSSVSSYAELLTHIGPGLAGGKATLTVSRSGESRDIEVTLGKFKHSQPVIAAALPDLVFGLRVDYDSILLQPSNANVKHLPPGVSVRDVTPNSPAATAFKKIGDDPKRWLVTHINGIAVSTPTEFYKAAKGQQSVKLTVLDPTERDRKEREVTLP